MTKSTVWPGVTMTKADAAANNNHDAKFILQMTYGDGKEKKTSDATSANE